MDGEPGFQLNVDDDELLLPTLTLVFYLFLNYIEDKYSWEVCFLARIPRLKLLLLPVFVLLGVAARITSDALHVPGYYTSSGALAMAFLFSPTWGLLSGILSGLMLSAYYNVYLISFWVPGLVGAIAGYVWRKTHPLLGAIVAGFLQLVGWTIIYVLVGGIPYKIPWYWSQRGALILIIDGFVSTIIAAGLVYLVPRLIARYDSIKTTAILSGMFVIILILSAIIVYGNEWGITDAFSPYENYVKVHTKMDLVWLWMGEKGINNYYYPETRFNRSSPGYQVWIGLYWVQGYHDIRDVSLISQFAVWDQDFWLRLHGCPDPYTYVVRVENITLIEYKGHKAYLMYGSMITRSDVEPYEEIVLDGFFITYYDHIRDRTVIIYAAAVHGNFKQVKNELWSIVDSWRIP